MRFDVYLRQVRPLLIGAQADAMRDRSGQLSSLHFARAVLAQPETARLLPSVDLRRFQHSRAPEAPPASYRTPIHRVTVTDGPEITVVPIVREALRVDSLRDESDVGPRGYLRLLKWLLVHDSTLAPLLEGEGTDIDALNRGIESAMA